MDSKGTIIGRRFKKLPVEQDSLERALRRIRKAQSNGAKRMPRLWARAKGGNKDIAVKTAGFIMTVANEFKVDVIVMEHLDLAGRKRGSKRQRLHHWRAKYVQQIVEHQAHRCVLAFVACVLGIHRSWPLTEPVTLRETRTTTACVRSRRGSAIRATCQLRTTSELGTSSGSTRSPFRQRDGGALRLKFRHVPRGSHAPWTLSFGLTRSCAPCERRFLSLPAICAQAVLAGKRQGSPVQLIIGRGGVTTVEDEWVSGFTRPAAFFACRHAVPGIRAFSSYLLPFTRVHLSSFII